MKNNLENKFSDEIKESTKYHTIKNIIREAIDKYPILDVLILKTKIYPVVRDNADACTIMAHKDNIFNSNIKFFIIFSRDFFYNAKTSDKHLKSILWHEIGHILSICVHTNYKHFLYLKNGEMITSFYGKYRLITCKEEFKIRLKLIDIFWENERSNYKIEVFEMYEQRLNINLIDHNNGEFLAECYKYAHIGEEFFSDRDDDEALKSFLEFTRNIVSSFNEMYVK